MRYLAALAAALWLTAAAAAQTEGGLPPLRAPDGVAPGYAADADFVQLLVGYKTWLSYGQSVISMSGTGGYPNILSELKWTRLINPIQELSVETVLGGRFITRFDIGAGTGGSGNFRDQDFNDDDRTNLTSDSSHPANDNNIFYFNLDFGYRVWEVTSPTMRFTGDVFLGYQFWQEKYIAHDGAELFPDPGAFPPGRVVANTFRWSSFRIGGRTELELSSWTVSVKAMFIPVNYFRDDDIHYLRDDLLQNPSFVDRATGGFGVMLDTTVGYRIWNGLSVEAGYRLWYSQAGMGLDTARTTQGDIISPLHQVTTLRQGVLLGLHYRF